MEAGRRAWGGRERTQTLPEPPGAGGTGLPGNGGRKKDGNQHGQEGDSWGVFAHKFWVPKTLMGTLNDHKGQGGAPGLGETSPGPPSFSLHDFPFWALVDSPVKWVQGQGPHKLVLQPKPLIQRTQAGFGCPETQPAALKKKLPGTRPIFFFINIK